MCAKSTTQEDNYKNQGPVGQSPNGSRGDNFLEIEKKTKKISLWKKLFYGCRTATNNNWAINWLCAKSQTQEDYRNQGPVGQSRNGSRGDNFLEIEKSIYQKSDFLDVELQLMIIGQ